MTMGGPAAGRGTVQFVPRPSVVLATTIDNVHEEFTGAPYRSRKRQAWRLGRLFSPVSLTDEKGHDHE
ncbi:protein of unknown function [Rhodovastum atsumiense]|nr:protein of unknown function [Rhodovastum atsumiense]